jgi:hypothetical protein
VSQHKIVYLLSIKSGKDILPIEDNCLEEERSNNYCLRSVVLNVPDVYDVFLAVFEYYSFFENINHNDGKGAFTLTLFEMTITDCPGFHVRHCTM